MAKGKGKSNRRGRNGGDQQDKAVSATTIPSELGELNETMKTLCYVMVAFFVIPLVSAVYYFVRGPSSFDPAYNATRDAGESSFSINKFLFYCLLGAYAYYVYQDKKPFIDGDYKPWLGKLSIWNKIGKYYDTSIVLDQDLNTQDLHIFAAFPHGTTSLGHSLTLTDMCGFLSKIYPLAPVRHLAANVCFYVPVMREVYMWLGHVSCDKAVAKRQLEQGNSLWIYVGGLREQVRTRYNSDTTDIVIKDRKGFVKIALESGSKLTPVYCFGETDLYYTSTFMQEFREMLVKKFRFCITLSYGDYGLPIPLKKKMTLAIGKPIAVEKYNREDITQEMVDTIHQQFMDALVELHDRRKVEAGYPNSKLNLI